MNSVPQTEVTTIAFSYVSILLLWVTYTVEWAMCGWWVRGLGGGLVGSSGLGAKLVEYKWLSGWVITSAY